eukprot:maker-scaffold_7-snap-gene-11.40-mRNA-1 protein AED:0.00 eAED:0.00 QI:154/1/1/1/1/1/2/79/376
MSVYALGKVVTAHAWNHDGSQVAVCLNTPVVYIYANCKDPNVKNWEVVHTLEKHTLVVSGIDWSPKTNKIVTSSHDVNAFVWAYDSGSNEWKQELVILRINRAALSARWSPDGTKFAVASGDKAAPISYFESRQKWWVSKILKKHKSTVLDVAWHPSSHIIATASCDFKCRVFNVYIADIDRTGKETVLGNTAAHQFGQLLTEFSPGTSWVESCAWSPSGEQLAFCGHDSTVSIATFDGVSVRCATIKLNGLPYSSLMFLSESVFIAAGYGFQPEIFSQKAGVWKLVGSADAKTGGGSPSSKKSGVSAMKNLKMFENRVKRGTTAKSADDDLKTLHHNVVTGICKTSSGFSTSGNDGSLVLWDSKSIKKKYPELVM